MAVQRPVRRRTRVVGSDADAVRRRVLEAAEDLFGRDSFAGTKMSAVAAAANVATGSVYRYFPSKHALLVELLRDLNGQLRAAMSDAIGGATSQREIERRAYGAFFAFLNRHPNLFRIQREAEFVAPAAYREYWEELARRYARGAKEAMLRDEVDTRF